MPIEFPCTQCGSLLRTGDETAGRLAKCPSCGTVMTVPQREGAAPGPEGAGDGPTPFGGPAPLEATDSLNPYQAPPDHEPASPFGNVKPAIEQVQAPAICMIVMASLGVVTCLAGAALYGVLGVAMMNDPNLRQQNRPEDALLGLGIMIVPLLIAAALGALTIVGAVKMKNLRSYGLAMTAAILMVLPCFTPCGLLGTPFGIWALVVLAKPEVKAAFR